MVYCEMYILEDKICDYVKKREILSEIFNNWTHFNKYAHLSLVHEFDVLPEAEILEFC
jgi:hypothetical protein